MLDGQPGSYAQFCLDLDIPNIYSSDEDFQKKYAFDKENENSIFSNLNRAYDNAIVLREAIGSETLSYIQLAIYEMNKAEHSVAPLLELQKVQDNILAFWGVADDLIASENVRNIIKVGKRVERIDLYARLKQPKNNMVREIQRLAGRIDRCSIKYDRAHLQELKSLASEPELNYFAMVREIESLI